MATLSRSVRHHRSAVDMLGQLRDLAEIRAAFIFRLVGRQIVDVQHDRAAHKAETLQQDLLLILGQLKSNCFVHSANLNDESPTALSAHSVAAVASDGRHDIGAFPGSQPGRFIVQSGLPSCRRLSQAAEFDRQVSPLTGALA